MGEVTLMATAGVDVNTEALLSQVREDQERLVEERKELEEARRALEAQRQVFEAEKLLMEQQKRDVEKVKRSSSSLFKRVKKDKKEDEEKKKKLEEEEKKKREEEEKKRKREEAKKQKEEEGDEKKKKKEEKKAPHEDKKKKDTKRSSQDLVSAPFEVHHVAHVDKDYNWTGVDPDVMFEKQEKLGEGSFGAVFKVMHKELGLVFAAKIISADESGISDTLEKELTILKKCRSPNIVSYYGACVKEKQIWVLMDYCALGSLRDIIETTNRTLTEDEICAIMEGSLLGLSYLHRLDIAHLDIKAGNILLSQELCVKLTDFGVSEQLCTITSKRRSTILGSDMLVLPNMIGTPLWIAPEIVLKKPHTIKSDIWSLGITIIELAEGRPPGAGMNPMRYLQMVPNKPPPTLKDSHWSKRLKEFLAMCLVKTPEKRASTVELLSHPLIKNRLGQSSRFLQLLAADFLECKKQKQDLPPVPSGSEQENRAHSDVAVEPHSGPDTDKPHPHSAPPTSQNPTESSTEVAASESNEQLRMFLQGSDSEGDHDENGTVVFENEVALPDTGVLREDATVVFSGQNTSNNSNSSASLSHKHHKRESSSEEMIVPGGLTSAQEDPATCLSTMDSGDFLSKSDSRKEEPHRIDDRAASSVNSVQEYEASSTAKWDLSKEKAELFASMATYFKDTVLKQKRETAEAIPKEVSELMHQENLTLSKTLQETVKSEITTFQSSLSDLVRDQTRTVLTQELMKLLATEFSTQLLALRNDIESSIIERLKNEVLAKQAEQLATITSSVSRIEGMVARMQPHGSRPTSPREQYTSLRSPSPRDTSVHHANSLETTGPKATTREVTKKEPTNTTVNTRPSHTQASSPSGSNSSTSRSHSTYSAAVSASMPAPPTRRLSVSSRLPKWPPDPPATRDKPSWKY